jgi:DNA-binding CsgD family transcriptional regulator
MIHTLKPSEMTAVLVPKTCARCGESFETAGREYICNTCRVPRNTPTTRAQRLKAPLSPRDKQVIELVAAGCSNKEIGYRLSLAEGTIKVYLNRIFGKTGVSNRTDLASRALREQIQKLTEKLAVFEARESSRTLAAHQAKDQTAASA